LPQEISRAHIKASPASQRTVKAVFRIIPRNRPPASQQCAASGTPKGQTTLFQGSIGRLLWSKDGEASLLDATALTSHRQPLDEGPIEGSVASVAVSGRAEQSPRRRFREGQAILRRQAC
jgi:hypothetical protein